MTVRGTASEPEGAPVAVAWSFAPLSGVDSGATCTFGNTAALQTTVTCTDDGVFTLRLSGRDGVNARVVSPPG